MVLFAASTVFLIARLAAIPLAGADVNFIIPAPGSTVTLDIWSSLKVAWEDGGGPVPLSSFDPLYTKDCRLDLLAGGSTDATTVYMMFLVSCLVKRRSTE